MSHKCEANEGKRVRADKGTGKGEGGLTTMIASAVAETAQGGCTMTTMMMKTPSKLAEARRLQSIDDRVKDNCGALASMAATTTTVVKAAVTAVVTTNKETW